MFAGSSILHLHVIGSLSKFIVSHLVSYFLFAQAKVDFGLSDPTRHISLIQRAGENLLVT